ncbi:response regulator|uniref:response regulator n=1 Tax=Noviherbaspirillum sp. L7-7A TaxID=2850560 RepID=UPI001C2BF2A6|nr:response regulator [Noviherbaspirillum sp. L7-7A]MBV0878244.1 response regulator [Noviherbaspirillum sp. L7-7A]
MQTSSARVQIAVSRRALVIDDSSVERMLATAVLQKLGFAVHCAGTAEEALALLAHCSVDLVMCDLALPGMDGLTLLAALRACPAPPPCIVLSAHDDPRHALAAMQAGARAYLVKPLRLADMREAVAAIHPAQRPEPASEHIASTAAAAAADPVRLNRSVRRTGAAVVQPVRSVLALLLQAGIRATG